MASARVSLPSTPLTADEQLLGRDACRCDRSPQESFDRFLTHFKALLPDATERQILKLI